jgi:predicted double-glycine peptidase
VRALSFAGNPSVIINRYDQARCRPFAWRSHLRTFCALAFGLLLTCWSQASLAERAPPVQSLLELRQRNVVMQQWDLSCGAATLATILNFQHGHPISEREIAIGMMGREEYIENPQVVTYRQGFSLLDMKRFVDQRGYNGVGLGQLDVDDLIEHSPIIVPISLHGYQHFVVFRGIAKGRVLIADPAFGNRSMDRDEFEKVWIRFPEVGRIGFYVERTDNLIPPNRLQPDADDLVVRR